MSRKNKLKKLRRKAIKWSDTFYNRRLKKVEAWTDGASYETLKSLHDKVNAADKQWLKAVIRYQIYKAKEL